MTKTRFSLTTYNSDSDTYSFTFEEEMNIKFKEAVSSWEKRFRINIYKTIIIQYRNFNNYNNIPKAYKNNT